MKELFTEYKWLHCKKKNQRGLEIIIWRFVIAQFPLTKVFLFRECSVKKKFTGGLFSHKDEDGKFILPRH